MQVDEERVSHMLIQPRIRGFICTTAHPQGCAGQVREQIDHVTAQPPITGPRNVLVIGSSTGYGLATRIAAAFGAKAATLGVCFEKPAEDGRTATAGWYNTAAFEREATAQGLYAQTIVGDAFSDACKQTVCEKIRAELGLVDLVVYSLASPRRTDPRTGVTHLSAIKPIGQAFTDKTVDVQQGVVKQVTIEPASEEEIAGTVAVMGGEDWALWMSALQSAGVLAPDAVTVAYSYIGPALTKAIYREGTIGRAKDHLEATAHALTAQGIRAYVAVNKAVVTQSSSAIPVVPLYISLLFKVMKEKGLHEGCIGQMYRLLSERLYVPGGVPVDEAGRIRLDEREMQADVQSAVAALWESVNSENLTTLTDIAGYRDDFLRLFGFATDGVDYSLEVEPEVPISSLRD